MPEQCDFFAQRVWAIEHALEPKRRQLLAVVGLCHTARQERPQFVGAALVSATQQVADGPLGAVTHSSFQFLPSCSESRTAIKMSGSLDVPGRPICGLVGRPGPTRVD